jgi:hypothetical protein
MPALMQKEPVFLIKVGPKKGLERLSIILGHIRMS